MTIVINFIFSAFSRMTARRRLVALYLCTFIKSWLYAPGLVPEKGQKQKEKQYMLTKYGMCYFS